jgi:hypothetical protein
VGGGRGDLDDGVDGNLNAETGELLDTALRLAGSDEADRARWFLDHQQTHRGGRHRPQLNIVIDWDTVRANARSTAETLSGTVFDTVTTAGCCATPPCTGWS